MSGWEIALASICAAPGVFLGVVVATRRRWVVGGLLISLGAMPLALLSPDSADHGTGSVHGLTLVLGVVRVAGWVWFYVPPALLAASFPDGRLGRRWRLLLIGWPVFLVLFHVAVALDPESYGTRADQIAGAPPVSAPAWLVDTLGFGSLALLLALLAGSVARAMVRFRSGDAVVRRQIKWFAMSAALLPLVLVVTWLAYLLTDLAGVVVVVGLLLVFVSVPVTVAIAVLRHDLYDIDRLLSRTVGYVVLSGVLTSVFAVITVLSGVLLSGGSKLGVALATLACAVVFGLLRKRVQDAVDARFDRDRSNALVEVHRFVDAVRDGTAEPEQVEGALQRALRDPSLRVAYWLSSDLDAPWRDGRGIPVEPPDGQFLDVAVAGRKLATIRYDRTARRPQLLRDVLREAHLPLELAHSRLALREALAETEASRARLVEATDAERRRLERDLHDGAQQALIAIGMSLRLAQRRTSSGDPLHEVLARAVRDIQEAVGELRRLANGVRPRGLDQGLATALSILARSCPVPVAVRMDAVPVPETMATTAYYVAAEGLANALKHADAAAITIDVTRTSDELHVVVADDGCGGAVVEHGSGLAGLRDRVVAVGGRLAVESPVGRGTTVTGVLPCGS